MIEVVRPGALTTVQDRGRVGWAHLGVPRSGALDLSALDRANALVGNDPDAAGLEITLTGCTLRFGANATIAVTGATAVVTLEGQPTAQNTALRVRSAGIVSIGPARAGVRTYLAVRGGIDVLPVLGSRSTDTLSGLGPTPLRAGDLLPVGPPPSGRRDCPDAVTSAESSDPTHVPALGIRFGPRDDWFVGEAPEVLCGSRYTVTVRSNRVGARLAGEPLVRADAGEFPTEGLVLGSVQVTPDGWPIVFLADHPTTGGYPVIGVIDRAALGVLAQARPGASVRFRRIQ